MISEIFGAIRGALDGLISQGKNGDNQRYKTMTDIAGMIAGRKMGLNANLAKQAKRNIGQFPIIISNAIGDDQALKICEIVERTIADMILLCIQNGNNLLDLRDPESKRKFIESYTNAGRNALDNDVGSIANLAFRSNYHKNCASGIDALTLKRVANEAMYLDDMAITSSFEMTTLFNPCLSVEEEFEMGAVAPVSVPMGVATGNAEDDDDEVKMASEAKNNGNPKNINPQKGKGPSAGAAGSGNSASGSGSSGSGNGGSGSGGNGSNNGGNRHRSNNTTINNNNTYNNTYNYNNNNNNNNNGGGNDNNGGNGNNNAPRQNALYAPPRSPNGGRRIRQWNARLDGTKAAKIEEKISKLSPTIVNATVILQTPTDTLERNLAFGVKVNAHEVSSDELVKAIKDTYSSTSLVSRLIRWRSGELSFFKDVLLNLKEIKQTVAVKNGRNTKNGLSGVFASMRFMTKNSIAYDALTSNGALLPTVSIMLTLDEVDQIRNSCSKDLIKNTKDARELCNKLGLFGILIVDGANDSFYSFFNDDSIMYKKTSLKDNKNKNSDDVVKAIFGALKR